MYRIGIMRQTIVLSDAQFRIFYMPLKLITEMTYCRGNGPCSRITQQANQYTISALSGQALTSDNAYTFRLDGASRKTTVLLPVSDTGNTPVNQQVILTVQEGAHAQQSGGCFGGGGSCGNSHENRTEAVITINFTVQ